MPMMRKYRFLTGTLTSQHNKEKISGWLLISSFCFSCRPFTVPQVLRKGTKAEHEEQEEDDEDDVSQVLSFDPSNDPTEQTLNDRFYIALYGLPVNVDLSLG